MKIAIPLLFSGLLFFFTVSSRADDAQSATTNAVTSEISTNTTIEMDETNAVLLKDLMSSNNIVTNTVGTVLVKISATLWAGKYEVTQKEYQKVAGGNPSAFSGEDHPVDSVSWNDAMAFCQKLTTKELDGLPDGFGYTLPAESQWEMLVADASLKDAVMKLNGERSSTAPVGSLGPNSLGLYDTRGNVMEWCLDSHDPSYHVLRGGAWDTLDEPSSRLVFRNYASSPDETKNDYGFRILLESASK
ncbi:MAG TPA: SUMF1/EgtB/PvdO family nonheme iron enzyme [Methylomirabilota bacterium]|nr:SUMF1/EgtB/PvdO family nonheme iron enzyme [Methylomirabilota bacterium]